MVTQPPSVETSAPICPIRSSIVPMSRTCGIRFKMTGWSVKRHAASAGSAAFLDPLTLISPIRGTPPSITNLSNGLQSLPDLSLGARQQFFRLFARYLFLLHDDGDPNAAPRPIQKLCCLLIGHSSCFLNDAPRPILEFLVRRLDVHHQIAIDMA